MNKKELEKMFDEKFEDIYYWKDDIMQFIFETIIPEVLRDICIKQDFYWLDDTKISLNDIKQKAKEKFWIDL
jgi:hypothetical protein